MRSTWIFQASPNRWDARRGLASLNVVEYKVARYGEDIKPDDRVYFWISGSGGGLYARGTVADAPSVRTWTADGYEVDQPAEGARLAVSVAIDEVLRSPVPREVVRSDSRLQELSLLRQPQGTNFAVSPAEAIVLEELFIASLQDVSEFSWTLPLPEVGRGEISGQEKPQHERNRRFWAELLARPGVRSLVGDRVGPRRDPWLGTAIRPGMRWNFVAFPKVARVELKFSANGQASFDRLAERRSELDVRIQFDRGRREGGQSKVFIPIDFGMNDEARWDELQRRLVEEMQHLQAQLGPFLYEL